MTLHNQLLNHLRQSDDTSLKLIHHDNDAIEIKAIGKELYFTVVSDEYESTVYGDYYENNQFKYDFELGDFTDVENMIQAIKQKIERV